ncbi:hypothetical protein BKK56_06230 [Rodentibacter genomosp. 2]|uniref:hypothetical protein n=1 Tax=Rodentibacter genomosp. 2 TaxID=1908266 RepID=UPI0009854387|nr:hypothetical protein BKK56_06230 [Rodentibacter genomosp. 2]
MKKVLLVVALFNLNACIFLPQNNDKIIPADTPLNKVVTLIQKDQVSRINAMNKNIIRTTLIIDGEEVKRFYFNKSEIVRRFPVPQQISVKCTQRTDGITTYGLDTKIHFVTEKLEEGKTYIFMCQGLNSYMLTDYNIKNITL